MRTQCFDSRFVYFWKVIHTAVQQMTPRSNHQQKHSTFVRSGNGEQRFPGLGSLKLYSSCYQLFVLSFFTVKLHSYTVKYMFLNFSTQWNPIGWRNWRWKAALEPGSWISLITFTLLVFRTKQGAWHKRIQLMKSFHFPSTRTTNSVRLILGSQYSLCEN